MPNSASKAVARSQPGSSSGARQLLAAVAAAMPIAAATFRRLHHQRLRRLGRLAANHSEAGAPSLESEKGVDFTVLRDLLQVGDFKAADAESRRLLIELAGEAALCRGWVYFAEVRRIPVTDFNTLDNLWQFYSKGKFGFVAQRKIWRSCRGQFDKFAEEVSWFTEKWTNRNWPDDFIYNLDAPVGHLPLTNCIRGAQVLQELLSHPALENKKALAPERWTAPAAAPAVPESEPTVKQASAKRSPLSMLAFGGCSSASGGTAQILAGPRGSFARPKAASVRRAAAVLDEAQAELPSLESLKEQKVINERGFILPEIPAGTAASAFVIYDAQHKAQYIGFSKDLRNTLRTLLCRRPENTYFFKCHNVAVATQDVLIQLRTRWIEELGDLPPGNKDARQKQRWESPVDGGALSERAFRAVAEQRSKQILQQLKDRGLKEEVLFKQDLFDQGKVDCVPSALNVDDLASHLSALSSRTRQIHKEVGGIKVEFEVFYMSELATTGGWWFDIEVSADKSKSTHRVIVGKDLLKVIGNPTPREAVESAVAVLLARRVPRKTDGLITSEVFPSNYFTLSNLSLKFPEYLDMFGSSAENFDWHRASWNFRQVHDYSQDEKRTIPAGPERFLKSQPSS